MQGRMSSHRHGYGYAAQSHWRVIVYVCAVLAGLAFVPYTFVAQDFSRIYDNEESSNDLEAKASPGSTYALMVVQSMVVALILAAALMCSDMTCRVLLGFVGAINLAGLVMFAFTQFQLDLVAKKLNSLAKIKPDATNAEQRLEILNMKPSRNYFMAQIVLSAAGLASTIGVSFYIGVA
jgi:hypothetical protein